MPEWQFMFLQTADAFPICACCFWTTLTFLQSVSYQCSWADFHIRRWREWSINSIDFLWHFGMCFKETSEQLCFWRHLGTSPPVLVATKASIFESRHDLWWPLIWMDDAVIKSCFPLCYGRRLFQTVILLQSHSVLKCTWTADGVSFSQWSHFPLLIQGHVAFAAD